MGKKVMKGGKKSVEKKQNKKNPMIVKINVVGVKLVSVKTEYCLHLNIQNVATFFS